jgi:hypothetical protein
VLTLDATATARAAASVAGIHYLVDLEFLSGTLRYTTNSVAISHGGNTYTALGDLVEISAINESEDQAADKIVMSLSIVNTALLAAVIGVATEYRNRRARIWCQLIDDTYQPAGAAVLRWAGYMDRVTIERTPAPPEGGTSTGKINLECVRAGQARMRNASGLRRTHAQQMQRTSNADTGLRYTQALLEQPSLWLSKAFQASYVK